MTRLPCAGDLAPLLRRVVLIRETMLGGLVEHERDGGKGERCNGHVVEGCGVHPARGSARGGVGEALSNISERLAAIMGRPGGPLAGELADLATVTLDLLNMVEGNPEAEPDTNGEPCLGWSATGATGTLNVSAFLLDPEEEHDGREPHADDGNPSYVPPRLDVFPQALPTFPDFVLTAALEGLAHD